MVGGCCRCLSCFFTRSCVLLLGLCLHDVQASSCAKVFHGKVGDTVELPSCAPAEGISIARWRYDGSIIADKDLKISEKQFEGRLTLNPKNFSLTVRALTLQDSGNFSFVSAWMNETQRDTVFITLQVHKLITKQPVLTYNSIWHNLNESCTVLLECSATTDADVKYNWTVGNQTSSGSRLKYSIRAEDGDTEFTCTVYNFFSERSASRTVKCSNQTQEISAENIIVLSAAAGGCLLLIVIIVGIVLAVRHCRNTQPGSDSHDLTVYADINEVALENETMKPCSVYETIENRVSAVTPGPQTVYDKIQFSRMRKLSVSPYQDIS